ncbi:MAG: hypothetical protein IKF83_00725 [Clostridia bacterium]|nr:hypothetical protein [Clostridia bacterium]
MELQHINIIQQHGRVEIISVKEDKNKESNSNKSQNRAIDIFRESMTSLSEKYKQTTGVGSVASVGNITDFTKKAKPNGTQKTAVNLKRKFSSNGRQYRKY